MPTCAELRSSGSACVARPVGVAVFRKIYVIDWQSHRPPQGATASPLRQICFARFIRSVLKNITNHKLSRTPEGLVRETACLVSCSEHLATPVRTPRSLSRSEVLVRSIRSHLPISGSSSAGLSARHKHAGRAATGRRRELGLAREENEERAAALVMRVVGWGGARVGIAIRRPRRL